MEELGSSTYKAVTEEGDAFALHLEHQAPFDPRRFRARFTHPNLCLPTDLGRIEDSIWFAYPYHQGITAAELLQREKILPLDLVQSMVTELHSGLKTLHMNGWIYNCWKLDRVLYSESKWLLLKACKPVLTSPFHHVRNISAEMERAVEFLSPRQIVGEKQGIGSDYYSLAVLVYRMLTGEHPFPGEQPTERMLKILNEPFPDVRKLRPDTPDALAEKLADWTSIEDEEEESVEPPTAPSAEVKKNSPAVEDFLLQLGKSGEQLDEGEFTLEPERALQKLSQFQFRERHHFLRPLIAALADLEASSVQIECSSNGTLKVTADCSPLKPAELEDILYSAVKKNSAIHLSRLGLALIGALSAGAPRVVLQSENSRFVLKSLEDWKLSSKRGRGFSLEVQQVHLRTELPEELAGIFRFAPFEIAWNGTTLQSNSGKLHPVPVTVEEQEFLVEYSLESFTPGLYLRVSGLSFLVRDRFLFKKCQVILEGPWALDLSYTGVQEHPLQKALEQKVARIVLSEAGTIALSRPIDWSKGSFYQVLLKHEEDPAVLQALHRKIVETSSCPEQDQPIYAFDRRNRTRELYHPLLEISCEYLRLHGVGDVRRACRILTTKDYMVRERDWEEAKKLARGAFALRDLHYWSYLIRNFLYFRVAPTDRDELCELLSQLYVVPRERRAEWDFTLANRLYEIAVEQPENFTDLRREWVRYVDYNDFPRAREWLLKGQLVKP